METRVFDNKKQPVNQVEKAIGSASWLRQAMKKVFEKSLATNHFTKNSCLATEHE
ncbi:MAG: hypothetical protein H7Y36_07980 [Armatimonadetes bacterium]|nr:hypothetical protein [Akkermansiaceae bacterium]